MSLGFRRAVSAGARLVSVVISVVLSACACASSPSGAGLKRDKIVRVGPQPGVLSVAGPIRLSISQHQQVHWIAAESLKIGFPDVGFPVLSDGTRVAIPPFKDMKRGGIHTEAWFFPEFNTNQCNTGEINPAMSELLDRAPNRQLEYEYAYLFRGQTSTARLIIEE